MPVSWIKYDQSDDNYYYNNCCNTRVYTYILKNHYKKFVFRSLQKHSRALSSFLINEGLGLTFGDSTVYCAKKYS